MNCIFLDVANQHSAIRQPQDQPKILSRYPVFGMGQPRGSDMHYYALGPGLGEKLPDDLSKLLEGVHYITTKDMPSLENLKITINILDTIIQYGMTEEVEEVQSIVIIGEAHNLLKKRGNKEEKALIQIILEKLEKILKEGRKYGVCVIVVTQSFRDFSRDFSPMRGNFGRRFTFRCRDHDIDFVKEQFEVSSRDLVNLKVGEVFFHDPDEGVAKIAVRPPYSKVWDHSWAEVRRIYHEKPVSTTTIGISEDEKNILNIANEYTIASDKHINMETMSRLSGITSKRKLCDLLSRMEAKKLIKTETLPQRGRPRVIVPLVKSCVDEIRT